MLKNAFMMFVSLGTGYAMCVLAKKDSGVLKTLGYTLGISVIVLSLLYGLLASEAGFCMMGKSHECGMEGPRMTGKMGMMHHRMMDR